MALTDSCFITLDEAKDYLGIEAAVADFDEMLETWIDLVCKRAEEEIDGYINEQQREEFYDGSGTNILRLESPITELYYDDSDDPSDEDKETRQLANLQYRNYTDAENWQWSDLLTDTDNLVCNVWQIELIDGTFPKGHKNIRLKSWSGFSPIPGKLRIAALEMLQMMWDESRQGGNLLGKGTRSLSGSGTSWGESLVDQTARWERTWKLFRKPSYSVSLINM